MWSAEDQRIEDSCAAPVTDVLIIGLGGAGGIAADVLTRAGLEVVALEAGPRRAPADMTLDELRNDVHAWLAEPKARGELPTWRADDPPRRGSRRGRC